MSLVILNRRGAHELALLDEYGGSEHICRLKKEHAYALGGEHNRIGFSVSCDKDEPRHPVGLNIKRVPVKAPGDLPWEIRVVDELAARITDDGLRALIEFGNPTFEPGQPDWQSREIEQIDFTVESLEGNIRHIRDTIKDMLTQRVHVQQRMLNRDLPEPGRSPVGEFLRLSQFMRDMDVEAKMEFRQGGADQLTLTREKLLPEHEAQLAERLKSFLPYLRDAGIADEGPRGYVTVTMNGKVTPRIEFNARTREIDVGRLEDMSFREELATPVV